MKNNINKQIKQVTGYAALLLIGAISRVAELVNQATKPKGYTNEEPSKA